MSLQKQILSKGSNMVRSSFGSLLAASRKCPNGYSTYAKYQSTIPALNYQWVRYQQQRFGSIKKFALGDIGEGITAVEVLQWFKKEGDHIGEMEVLCEVQTDKASLEITSRYEGKIVHLDSQDGRVIKVGDIICDIETADDDAGEPSKEGSAEPNELTEPPKPPTKRKTGQATPRVKREAAKHGVDLSNVKGTGEHGVVTMNDLQIHLSSKTAGPEKEPGKKASTEVARPQRQEVTADQFVQFSPIGRGMFKSMTATAAVPQLNIMEDIDMTRLLALTKQLKQYAPEIRVTAVMIKLISTALKDHPKLNSKCSSDGSGYTMFSSHNISVAIDTPDGLLVPTIKDVQDKSIREVQADLLHLQEKAKAKKLSPSDLSGGTFSVSNVGSLGGSLVNSLLFDGQGCILGIGRPQDVLSIGENKELITRRMAYFGMTADHRHIDGASVCRFLTQLKKVLEQPEVLLLECV